MAWEKLLSIEYLSAEVYVGHASHWQLQVISTLNHYVC